MLRRNWLDLSRKLVDRFDLDVTLNAIQTALNDTALSFWGEGVLATTLYPNPFTITMHGGDLGGTVGSGIAYNPVGQMTRIDPASLTSKIFTPTASHPTLARYDLLVIRYKTTGDTPVPKPSDPILTVFLNLHDDFELAVIAGIPSITPIYPVKGPNDIILAGLQVPAAAVVGVQITVDYLIREMAIAGVVQRPEFIQEPPASGAINGINQLFTISGVPMNNQSLLVMVDDRVLTMAERSIIGQNVTLAVAPALGQSVYFYYVANVVSSQNPLSGWQETPAGAVDGINPNFVLVGKPADQSSTLVMVDGLALETSKWSLVQGFTADYIQFLAGSIPAPGQSVYVFYLVNAASVGIAPIITGGGSGWVVYGLPLAPAIINPVIGIPASSDDRQERFVKSAGGAIPVTANPQVAPGVTIGQEMLLVGTSDVDYMSLADGSGLSLNGPINLTNHQAIVLNWNGIIWFETSRR